MSETSKIKIGLTLFFGSIFLCLVIYLCNSAGYSPISKNQSAEFVLLEKPDVDKASEIFTPSIKQKAKVKSQSSPVKFERDFETSLKIQELPELQLEFTDENNQIEIVQIPNEAKEILRKRWTNTIYYSYKNSTTSDRNTKFEIEENYLNDAAVFATKINTLDITTPFGKRKIFEDEAFALVNLTAKLAIERYEELRNMASQTNTQKISRWNF